MNLASCVNAIYINLMLVLVLVLLCMYSVHGGEVSQNYYRSFAKIAPEKNNYEIGSVLYGCFEYREYITEQGNFLQERNNNLLKFEVVVYDYYLEQRIFTSHKLQEGVVPVALLQYKGDGKGVFVICENTTHHTYKQTINVEGFSNVQATVPNHGLLFNGKNVKCSSEESNYAISRWEHISGYELNSQGDKLLVSEPKVPMRSGVTITSKMQCSSTFRNGITSTRTYTYYIALEYKQYVYPIKKDGYIPTELIECVVFASTFYDLMKSARVDKNIGIHIKTHLVNGGTRLIVRKNANSVPLPDYLGGVLKYEVKCLVNGDSRTGVSLLKAKYRHYSYVIPNLLQYHANQKVSCASEYYENSNKLKLAVVRRFQVYMMHYNKVPILDYKLVQNNIVGKAGKEITIPGNTSGLFYLICMDPLNLLLYAPKLIVIKIQQTGKVVVLHPRIDPEPNMLVISGTILQCVDHSNANNGNWMFIRGDSLNCKLPAVGDKLPLVSNGPCIAEYLCNTYDPNTNLSVPFYITLEIISDYKVMPKPDGTVYVIGNVVYCKAYGYSFIQGTYVAVKLGTRVWIGSGDGQPVANNDDTNVIKDIQVNINYFANCQDKAGKYTKYFPLTVTFKKIFPIFTPILTNFIYPGEEVFCYSNITLSNRKIQIVYGLVSLYVNGHLHIPNTNKIVVPVLQDLNHYLTNKTKKLELRVQCMIEKENDTFKILKMASCNKTLPSIYISPEGKTTFFIGQRVLCISEAKCQGYFNYMVTISDRAAKSETLKTTTNEPLVIDHTMLGTKTIRCRSFGTTVKRDSREITVESIPLNLRVLRYDVKQELVPFAANQVIVNDTLECVAEAFPKARITWRPRMLVDKKGKPVHRLAVQLNQIFFTIFDPPGYYEMVCEASNKHDTRVISHGFYLSNPRFITQGMQFSIMIVVIAMIGFFLACCGVGIGLLTYEFFKHPRIFEDFYINKAD